jgi:hypothetical protein
MFNSDDITAFENCDPTERIEVASVSRQRLRTFFVAYILFRPFSQN